LWNYRSVSTNALGKDTYKDAYKRVQFLKDIIENKGGHRIFYFDGEALKREEDLHILYRLTWYRKRSSGGHYLWGAAHINSK